MSILFVFQKPRYLGFIFLSNQNSLILSHHINLYLVIGWSYTTQLYHFLMKSSAIMVFVLQHSRGIYMKEEQTCSIFHSLLKFLKQTYSNIVVTRVDYVHCWKYKKSLPTIEKLYLLLLLAPYLNISRLGTKRSRKPFYFAIG